MALMLLSVYLMGLIVVSAFGMEIFMGHSSKKKII